MKNLSFFVLLLSNIYSFAQTDSVSAENPHEHRNLTAHLIELMQIQGRDSIDHKDDALNYRIMIPKWWKIRETSSPAFFGGTFPAVEGIENALLLKSFSKEDFTDFDEFEGWTIKKYKLGDIPEWSNQHKILLIKPLDDFKSIGRAYFVQLMLGNKIYHCCYIAVETPNTFLWIDFTATQETYTANFEKFKSLLSGFNIIKQ